MRTNIAGLPEFIVRRMRKEFMPFRSVFEEGNGVGERAHAEKKIVTVRRFEIVPLGVFMEGIIGALGEHVEEAEILGKKKRAIVMDVIAHEPIGNRRLRRSSFERR